MKQDDPARSLKSIDLKGEGNMSSMKNTIKDAERLKQIIAILKKHDAIHGFTPEKLRLILLDLGPTYIKLGQIMSFRTDILPEEYCLELTKLRARVPPMPFETVREIIEQELKKPLTELFSSFGEESVGSASIAQVHPAVLKSGESVVVKIQRQGIYEKMEQDMSVLKKAGSILKLSGKVGKNLDFSSLIDELWGAMKEELDFTKEANNLVRFMENQKDVPYVTSPTVYMDYTTSRILTMMNMKGFNIIQKEAIQEAGIDFHQLGVQIAENYCKQVIDDRFFHGDPHTGNIRVMDGKVAWIDLGMMGVVSDALYMCITDCINAIISNDMFELTDAFFRYCEPGQEIDRTAVARKFGMIVQQYLSSGIGQMDMGRLFTEMTNVIQEAQVKIPQEMTVFVKSLVTIEGTIAYVSPDISFITIVSDYMKAKKLRDLDPVEFLKKSGQKIFQSSHKTMGLPADLADMVKLLKNGNLSVRTETVRSPKELRTEGRRFANIIRAMLMTGLYLLAGLTASATQLPTILGLPWLSFAALVIGTILLFTTLVDTWRMNKK